MRWFLKPGLEDKTLTAAVRFSERATFCVGLDDGGVHGGAIETVLDEITAEYGKTKLFPILLTSTMEVKMGKVIKADTTYRVFSQVANERVKDRIAEVTAEITDWDQPDEVYASCKATLVNYLMTVEQQAAAAAASVS